MPTAQEVQDFIRAGLPAAESTALTVEYVGENKAVMRSPFNPKQIRPGGTLSGPTMMALADAAMYVMEHPEKFDKNQIISYAQENYDQRKISKNVIIPIFKEVIAKK